MNQQQQVSPRSIDPDYSGKVYVDIAPRSVRDCGLPGIFQL
jgi:hypothetical protein